MSEQKKLLDDEALDQISGGTLPVPGTDSENHGKQESQSGPETTSPSLDRDDHYTTGVFGRRGQNL